MSESAFSALIWGRPVDSSSIGGLSDLRLIDLNLIYTIKEKILPINGYVNRYSELISAGTVESDPFTGLPVTPYKGYYNDWVYYNPDPTNPALTGLITTPLLSQSGNLAYIDYPNGTVYYSGSQSSDVTVEYDYYSVFVQDGYPEFNDETNFENVRVPVISVDFFKRTNNSFALGGKYEELRFFVINVTSPSDPERDDLMDILETSLRYDFNDTIDYSNGFPIDGNGDKNLVFDRNDKWKRIRFLENSSSITRNPKLPDKLRHQGSIALIIQIV